MECACRCCGFLLLLQDLPLRSALASSAAPASATAAAPATVSTATATATAKCGQLGKPNMPIKDIVIILTSELVGWGGKLHEEFRDKSFPLTCCLFRNRVVDVTLH